MTLRAPVLRLACLTLLLAAGATRADHEGLDGNEDFAQLARGGFSEVVDGTMGELVPNALGRSSNSYAWSMGWHQGSLWVGTVRDVLCFLGGQSTETVECELGEQGELPLPGADQRAEIWRYTPAGPHGLSGAWQRVFQSPFIEFPANLFLPPETPRDVGYRGMTLSDAGGTERLYVATLGVPGRILYLNPQGGFSTASLLGLRAGAADLVSGEYDLGYRSLVHFQGRLWTSPVGTLVDTDISDNPVLLANSDPVGGAPWIPILHLQDDPVLGDPDNIAIFKMIVAHGRLHVAVTNRVDGLRVWRTDGTGCTDPAAPCNPIWEEVITDGGGRPPDGSSPVVDNTTGELAAFDGMVYVGSSEAAAFDANTAEMMRIREDGTWELVVGWPRLDYAGIPNLHCASPLDLDGDLAADDCLPLSGRGPGMGSSAGRQGPASYFWRMQAHDGHLFAGTLTLATANGFSLWRSPDGIDWSVVSDDGLGNALNYGVRTMQSTELGLFVGTANPFSGEPRGGLEVFLGTTGPDLPPVAEAGADRTWFDDESYPAPGDGRVTVELDGSGSAAPFGGHLAGHEWFAGDLAADCAGIETEPLSTEAVVEGLELAAGSPFTDHPFTVRVRDEQGRVDCDVTTLRASGDLPPLASIRTEPPLLVRFTFPSVRLADFDGDGVETFELTGTCFDPEGALVHCGWETTEEVVLADPAASSTLATVSVSGGSDPGLRLTARDAAGYEDDAVILVRIEANPEDTPDSNDRPVCRTGVFTTTQGKALVIDPTDPGHRLCLDPDHADETLSYTIREEPSHGTLGPGSFSYTPDPGFTGEDVFQWRACDPGGACSSTMAMGITVLADRDGDGLTDAEDSCPDERPNDADGDRTCAGGSFLPPMVGAGDECPFDRFKTSPGACGCGNPDDTSDADGDGVPACFDNCPEVANAGQEDADGDGFGDACLIGLGLASVQVEPLAPSVALPLTLASGAQCIDRAELSVAFDPARAAYSGVEDVDQGCSVLVSENAPGLLEVTADCEAGLAGTVAIASLRFTVTGLAGGEISSFGCLSASGERCADGSAVPAACSPAVIGAGCTMGDVDGDGGLDLLDLVAARAAVRDGLPLEAGVAACADLAPGAATCSELGRLPSWCPEGDGLLDGADLSVLRRLAAGLARASCDDCLSTGPEATPADLRRIGDVAPAGAPDGRQDVGDVVRVLRMAVDLETPTAEELLRSDVAPTAPMPASPRTAGGDGRLDVADVVLLLNVVVGLEELVWPLRTLGIAVDEAVAGLAFQVRTAGWPLWAEPLESVSAGCTGVPGEGLDAAAGTWAATCLADPALFTVEAGGELLELRYRAPQTVDPAGLAASGAAVDAGGQLVALPSLSLQAR